jgi:hypothetical protein
MATAPQSKFDLTLPTQDNATPPNTLTAGEITSVVFTVNGTDHAYTLPAGLAAGAAVVALFSACSPAFVPVAGTAYTADVYAVDANGNGIPSASIEWTQAAPVPLAPTGFSVA